MELARNYCHEIKAATPPPEILREAKFDLAG
jgi:hypothetical protein